MVEIGRKYQMVKGEHSKWDLELLTISTSPAFFNLVAGLPAFPY